MSERRCGFVDFPLGLAWGGGEAAGGGSDSFVEGFDERHGSAVGEDAGFHLVHDVSEADAAFGVGEGEAAAGAGVTERVMRGAKGFAEFVAMLVHGIAHEAEGKCGGHEEHAVGSAGLRGGVGEDA